MRGCQFYHFRIISHYIRAGFYNKGLYLPEQENHAISVLEQYVSDARHLFFYNPNKLCEKTSLPFLKVLQTKTDTLQAPENQQMYI